MPGFTPPPPALYTPNPVKLYPPPPTEAPAKWCSSGITDWTFGSWAELVPANTIPNDFIVVGVIVIIAESFLTRFFSFEVGKGDAGQEEPIFPLHDYFEYWASAAPDYGRMSYYYGRTYLAPTPIKVPANTRIAIRACDDAGKATDYIARILYIELPL